MSLEGDIPPVKEAISITAVSVKIPSFWPADPQIWFAQIEAQFCTRGITSEKMMFDHIIASLTPEYAQEVRDLILSPPDTNPYTQLKKQLVDRTAASEQRRLQQLFHAEELGDRRPTQLLRRMQQLLGRDPASSTDTAFLRELFLQRLPANVRMVVASMDAKDLPDLAQLADKIMDVYPPTISTVTASPEVAELRSEVASLRQLVESLARQNSTLDRPDPYSFRKRTPSRSRPASPVAQSTSSLCWYHRQYGQDARKCTPPCSAQSQGNDQASR